MLPMLEREKVPPLKCFSVSEPSAARACKSRICSIENVTTHQQIVKTNLKLGQVSGDLCNGLLIDELQHGYDKASGRVDRDAEVMIVMVPQRCSIWTDAGIQNRHFGQAQRDYLQQDRQVADLAHLAPVELEPHEPQGVRADLVTIRQVRDLIKASKVN